MTSHTEQTTTYSSSHSASGTWPSMLSALWSWNGEYVGGAVGRTMLTGTEGSKGNRPSSSNVLQKKAKPIKISGQDTVNAVALLVDRKHVMSGGDEGKIRRWRIEDGKEAAGPLNAEGRIFNIAVSRDGQWVAGGTNWGRVL
jgi:WD40 repeat protein